MIFEKYLFNLFILKIFNHFGLANLQINASTSFTFSR